MNVSFFLFLVLMLNSQIRSGERTSPSRAPKPLLNGSYLDVSYIQRLRATLSPYESAIGMLAEVNEENNGQKILLVQNYHEGAAEYFVDRNGIISIPTGIDRFVVTAETVILERRPDAGEIIIDLNKHTVLHFVGDPQEFVNGEVLCGSYVDDHNQRYFFKREKIAVLPGHEDIRYTLGLDFIENRFDYITTSKKEVIGFKRTTDGLSLFKTSGEVSQNINPQPYLQLKRVRDRDFDRQCVVNKTL